MATLSFACAQCRTPIQVDDRHRGKQVRCPKCQAVLTVPGPAPAAPQWFVARNRQRVGPYPADQLRQMAAAGQLRPTDMLMRSGEARWTPASSVPGLFPAAAAQAVTASPAPAPVAAAAAPAPAGRARVALGAARAGVARLKPSRYRWPILAGAGALGLLFFAGILYLLFRGPGKTEVASPEGKQDEPPPRKKLDVAFAADSFNSAVVIHPQRLLKSKAVAPLPLDKLLGPAADLGLDPRKVEQAVLYIDPFPGGNVLFFPGAVLRFSEPVNAKEIIQKLFPGAKEASSNGKAYSTVPGIFPNFLTAVYQPDDRTVVAAPEEMFKKMLGAKPEKGPLIDRLRQVDLDNDLVAVFAVEPVRVMARLGMKDLGPRLPEEFADVMKLPDNLEAVTLSLNLSGDPFLKLDLEVRDAAAAESVASLASLGKQLLDRNYPALRKDMEKDAPPEAGPAVMKVMDGLVAGLSVRQDGMHVRAEIKSPSGLTELVRLAVEKPHLFATGGPGPAGGADMTGQAVDWVRANNGFGPDDQVVKVVRDHLSKLKPGDGFVLALGAGLVKSKKATWVAGYGGKTFVFELSPEQARQAKIDESAVSVLPVAQGSFPAGNAFALSDPKIDNADRLDAGKGVTGSVAYRLAGKEEGHASVRVVFLVGNLRVTTYTHPNGPRDKDRLPIRTSPLDAKYSGPALAFIDVVSYFDSSRTGAVPDECPPGGPAPVQVSARPVAEAPGGGPPGIRTGNGVGFREAAAGHGLRGRRPLPPLPSPLCPGTRLPERFAPCYFSLSPRRRLAFNRAHRRARERAGISSRGPRHVDLRQVRRGRGRRFQGLRLVRHVQRRR